MNDSIYWLLEVSIQPRQLEEFRSLMKAMVESAKGETDTLSYDWTLSEDSRTCHLFERYADSGAVMIHARTFQAKFASKFLDLAQPQSMVVHGKPSPQVKDVLAVFNPTYMSPLGGFHR
ncbi:MAG TPA: antibiotic biosynthesis monooxygenase [Planctomycetota bacterium]|nr:antibiotic biosynthesis monooxygenase [Planctomycetota bacterium]